jgi:molecular chaperone DnaK
MMGGIVEVRASHGDTHLGGDDFDRLLAEHASKLFYKKHQLSLKDDRRAVARLTQAAEAAKIYLSDFPEASIREEYLAERDSIPLHLEANIERWELENMIKPFLDRTIKSIEQVLKDAELEIGALSRVLLVGGSTRMPIIWELVADYTGLEPDVEINPDEAVALGAAVQAAIIAGQPVDSILVDVTPYSLGIEAATEINGTVIPDIYSVLIRRNSTIPATKEQIFRTLYPDQDTVQVKVYQGEAPKASANTLLGEFTITGLQSSRPGDYPSVNVCFDFDVNGMLYVRATDRVSGTQEGIIVQATQARLTPQEIVQARKELSELDFFGALAGAVELDETTPELDEETEALLKRAQALLDSDTLTKAQAIALRDLMQRIANAGSQEELDDLSEELLDMLFDLE